jgi:CRP/FNR family transcriptional regulator
MSAISHFEIGNSFIERTSPEVDLDSLTSRPEERVESKKIRQSRIWSNIYEVCEILHLPCEHLTPEEKPTFQHLQFKTGNRIHAMGQAFDTLYIVNSGFLKTVLRDDFGSEQVLSFPMRGDILGIDSIHTKFYSSEAVALSDCDLILVPFNALVELGRKKAEFEKIIYNVLSRELFRKQALISLLCAQKADAKVARFLIYLSEKFHEMGYSRSAFSLRMTRQEIGSYLGLSLETVSRAMSALKEVGVIGVDQRSIKINESDVFKLMRSLPAQRSRPAQPGAQRIVKTSKCL